MKVVLILILIMLTACAQILELPLQGEPAPIVTRDVTAVDVSRDIENVRLVIHAKNGWLEQDNNTLYVRFNAKPVLSEQAENALRGLFVPCRYVGVIERSLTFRCRTSVAVYPDVTRDYIDIVLVP